MNQFLRCCVFLPRAAGILLFVTVLHACSDENDGIASERNTPQPPPEAPTPDITSVLQGGSYGKVVVQGVDKSSSPYTETLPAFGIYDGTSIETRGLDIDNQLFFPFGGFVSTFGPGVSKIGNAKTGTQVGLTARLYPNFDLLPEEGFVEVTPLLNGDDELLCFVTNSEAPSQMASYFADPDACDRGAFALPDFEAEFNALQFTIDLGAFPEEEQFNFVFRFALFTPDDVVEDAIVADEVRETYALLELTTNDAVAKALPNNVYASGNFNPSINGFGFANAGDSSFDLFSKELIAQEFGKESVCFVIDDECAALNPFGIYLTQVVLPHDGGNGLCNGFSVASTMLATTSIHSQYQGRSTPADYNANAVTAIELNYADVRQLIAAKHIGQFGNLASNYEDTVCSTLRPTDVIDRIAQGFNTADPITLIGIYNEVAGHAVTPYALSDEGGNIQRIYVYDNNFPSDMNRYIEVDITPGQESWRYFGSANTNAPGSLYTGTELENPMCPQPLSVYDDPEIAVQLPGTTRFIDLTGVNAQVEDADGNISGADFERLVNVNGIPNANLDRTIGQNILTISGLSPSDASTGTVFETIARYLDEGYVVRAQPVSDASLEALSFVQSSILRSDLTAAVDATFTPDVPYDGGVIQRFRAHKSARLITIEQPPSGELNVNAYITRNDQALGYVVQFEVSTDGLGDNDSVGVYISDDGASFSVFSYEAVTGGNFTQLRAGTDYDWSSQFLRAGSEPTAVLQAQVLE